MVNRGVLALIPARGGSRSIPRKNIRRLNGVPLIAYSIQAGLDASSVDRVIVSTDDEEIAALARRCGAEVPFLRPAELAGDLTTDLPVFLHALDWLEKTEGWNPEVVVQLRPTSPLRPVGLVDAAVATLREGVGLHAVRSVMPSRQNPYKMWRRHEDGRLVPLLTDQGPEGCNQPRQLLPETFWQTGHVDVAQVSTLRDLKSMIGTELGAVHVDPAYECDLDTEADWQRTSRVLRDFPSPRVNPADAVRWPTDPRLVVFDFDGVFTDNRVWVTEGEREWVACSRADGIGLARLRALGLETRVLSTEPHPVVAERCRKLGIPCDHGVADKGAKLAALMTERRLQPHHVIYVGNDVNDRGCLQLAGCAVVVADAHQDVVGDADVILEQRGGHGAVRELCDRLHDALTAVSSQERSHT